MRREHAGIDVVAAAGRKADVETDGLAAIEVADRIGVRRRDCEQRRGRERGEVKQCE
jgi:hypothetical protein